MTFGERLIKARENKGYKQNQFAEMLGITATRLNYWEKDKREPDVAMIKKISSLLEISSDWLIGNDRYYNSKNFILHSDEKNTCIILDDKEKKQQLLNNYSILNDKGKEKLIEYSDDLVSSKKYIKDKYVTVVKAARNKNGQHSIEKVQMTEEELSIFDTAQQSDEDL